MEAALFQRPLSVGGIIVPIEYQSRVFTAGGAIPATGRAINIYLQVTSIATPSLLCACDAYKATILYNIIPE